MKLVVELPSGQRVEMALILHDHKSSGGKRCTVCVSSQVGCSRVLLLRDGHGGIASTSTPRKFWSRYGTRATRSHPATRCATSCLWAWANRSTTLMRWSPRCELTHQALFDLSAKHLTVSTVGASPDRIRRLADLAPKVRLALALARDAAAARRAHSVGDVDARAHRRARLPRA